ncbi:CHAT domain-containing protein, partial [Aerosakkonema funiforme]|uniref:CHAT domain-containing protein n=1 Tax=Aerosakkonema funiforme TaxID=1246630 RepID=UPI0035B76A5E
TTAISPTPQIVESAIQPLDTESEETTIEEIIESRAKESSVSESADADLVEEPVSSVPTTAISATPQIVESAINRLEPESEETTESPAVAQISTKESSVSESADADLVELVSEIPTTVTSATPQIVGSAIQPLDTEEEAEETTTEATAESPDEALVRLSSDVDLEEEIAAETATRTTELTEIDESSANQASAVTEATTDGVEVWFNKGLQQAMAGDFQAAIANWNKALELKPDFYEAWNNRGNALANIGEYEEAIASYDRAVEYKPDYYQAWYNRGNALGNLGQHEEAIGCYSKAVEYKPDFYQAWYNKGCALYNVGQQEDAIASYSKALEFKSDYHQAWYNQGTLLYNIGKNEEAIAAYDRVIKFKPEDQQAWINRGIAARDSIDYNSTVASVSATQNQDLNLRGYEGELTSYQEGLKYCQQDTHPEGWGDLHRAIGNAHYFKGRSAPNPSDYYRQAVDEYNEALKTLTEADFPELHLEVLQSLVRADLGLGQKDEAAELHQRGIELLQRLLNEPQRSQYSKKQLALKQAAFQQLTVDIAIQSGQFIEALEAAEVGKNSCLYWLLYGWKDNVSSPKYAEIQQLLNPKTAVVYWHISPCALTTFIIKHDAPAPIVLPANRSLEKNEYLNRLVKFENWVKDWNQQYQEYQSKNSDALAAGEEDKSGIDWRDKLPETIAQLRQILGISTIELLLAGIDKLIFIPHRDLHRLPLHALFADKFRIAYLPSAQIGLNLLEKSSSSTQQQAASTLLSVEQPESAGLKPLLFAKIESGAIGQMFPNPTRLVGPSCTRPQLETLLQQPHSIFHFAGYSTDNSQNPSRSALALSGDDKLTLAEIVQIPFNEYQLIALSACETAVKGNQTISSEYVGLVSGFLYQGASHVLSTLWTVDDFSTALFTIRFYQLFKAGATPTVAFKEAQNWLRSVTYAQLAEWYVALPTDEIRDTDPEGWEHLQSLAKHIQDNSDNSSDPPYSHPYYWAGFTIAGKVNS